MSASARINTKVNRTDVLRYISDKIKRSKHQRAEISPSEIGKALGAQGPAVDYHIKQLIKDQKIFVSQEKGKYNRKIFRLGDEVDSAAFDDSNPFSILEFLESDLFQNPEIDDLMSLATSIESLKTDKTQKRIASTISSDSKHEQVDVLEEKLEKQFEDSLDVDLPEPIIQKDVVDVDSKMMDIAADLDDVWENNQKPVELNEKIHAFLNQMQSVQKAEVLLQKDDKEILAVMAETIQQNINYLRDLSDQLSTIQNKQLILGLLDERQKLLEQQQLKDQQINDLQQQILSLQKQTLKQPDKQSIRKLQQMITHTVDSYIDGTSQSLALNRNVFRKQLLYEVSQLANYQLTNGQ